jgi:hypothetical protein
LQNVLCVDGALSEQYKHDKFSEVELTIWQILAHSP